MQEDMGWIVEVVRGDMKGPGVIRGDAGFSKVIFISSYNPVVSHPGMHTLIIILVSIRVLIYPKKKYPNCLYFLMPRLV